MIKSLFNICYINKKGILLKNFILGMMVTALLGIMIYGGQRFISSDIAKHDSVLVQMREIAELHTAEYHIESIIETQSAGNWQWAFQDREVGLFIIKGKVSAGLNLASLTTDNIRKMPNGQTQITLPNVEILDVNVQNIQVYSIRTGELNILKPDFAGALDKVQKQARVELIRKACENGIMTQAQANAFKQMQNWAQFSKAHIVFITPNGQAKCQTKASSH